MIRHTRNNFTAATKREAYERSAGICECHLIPHVFKAACGRPLGPGNTFYEHIEPDRIGGLNDLDNCAALTKTCWKLKTSTYDRPTIDKSKRVADLARGIRSRSRLVGSRDSNIRIRMDRSVVYRDSGKPLFERRR